MKRYALSILLGLFIAAGIGGYYIYNAADRLPAFRLTALEGNADEAARIELSGSYGGRMRSEFLTVGTDGSDYRSRQSLYTQFISGSREWFTREPGIKELTAEHRRFMRGKGSPSGFYRDKEWLIYVKPANLNRNRPDEKEVIHISLLNLASGKTKQLQATVREGRSLLISDPIDVQRIGTELHIVGAQWSNSSFPDRQRSEYRDYVVDMTSGKLIREIKLNPGFVSTKETEYAINFVTSDKNIDPDDYCIIVVNENKVRAGKDGNSIESVATHLYSYSYKTGQLTALPESLSKGKPSYRVDYGLTGTQLHSLEYQPTYIRLMRYNLDTGGTPDEMTITAKQLGADKIQSALLEDDRLYVLLHRSSTAIAAVLNAADGTLLYKGEAVYDGPKAEAAASLADLSLLNLNLKP